MVILITGCSHTGKTAAAQKLLEKYKYPYLSLDHLKMGLIRSGKTNLTPDDDKELTPYLWSIAKEIVKTAIENKQNLIIEGCYIPFDWKKDFGKEYLEQILYFCLVMTESYIENNFSQITEYADIIEKRIDDSYCTKEMLIRENKFNLEMCKKYGCTYILIEDTYSINIELDEIYPRETLINSKVKINLDGSRQKSKRTERNFSAKKQPFMLLCCFLAEKLAVKR